MGTWSTAITSDDTVADVIGTVVEQLKLGATMTDASDHARRVFRDLLADPDDGPLFWLGLAAIQWKHGPVEKDVIERVQAVVREELGLDRWREDKRALEKRRAVLARFAEQVSRPNDSPKPLPKQVIRKAPFEAGDCLAIRVPDGRYTAALVLASDNSNPENGMNMVAGLDYLSSRRPDLADFKRRKLLRRHFGAWRGAKDLCWIGPVGFKKERERLELVGRLRLGWLDRRFWLGWLDRRLNSALYSAWPSVGQAIVLNRLHLGLPDDS